MPNIKKMRPGVKHKYLRANSKECPSCKQDKLLRDFWNKEENKMERTCSRCTKNRYKLEITKLVLNVIGIEKYLEN